ncbi:MAG: hypothetical protein Q8O67_12145 [Deltaproteobacteria bacterium]|nr:hypothetical protein [Deltaproteobacteria bacterium]
MRALVLFLVVACGFAASAGAQREFIEEVDDDANKGTPKNDDVDLDAPDVDNVKPLKPIKPIKDPPPDPVKDPKKDPTTTPADPKAPVVPPTDPTKVMDVGFEVRATTRAAFMEKLAPRFVAAKKTETARARRMLPEIEQAELDFAMPGLHGGFQARSLGLALALEAGAANADGRADDAIELAEAARRAAPDDVATLSSLAHLRWSSGDPLAALMSLSEIVPAMRNDPTALASVIARACAVVFGVVLVLLALLALVAAIPALSLLAFDVWVSLPRGSHIVQAWALVLLAAAAPVVAGAGIVFSVMWVITLGMLYMPQRLRIVSIVVGVLAAGLPLVADQFARAVVVPSSEAARLHLALFDVDGDAWLETLRARERASKPLSVHEAGALALSARREGRLDEALERWKTLVVKNGDVGWVHGGYGVSLANAGQDDLALAELGLAVQRADPSDRTGTVIAAFDASLLHHKAGRIEKAQSTLAGAAQNASDVVSELRRATFRAPDEIVGHNRAYVDVLPSRAPLVALAFEPSPAAVAVEEAVGRPLWRGLTGNAAAGALALFPLLWLALLVAARKLPVAQGCDRCGDPASRRVDGPDVPHGTCSGCFHVFLSSKSRVDATVKLKKERRIFLRSRRRATLVTLFSLLPGAGHLYAGAAARGAVLATLFALCAAAVVVTLDLVPGPRPTSPWSSALLVAPFVVVAVIVFIVGIRSALGVADDERAGGRL